MNVIRLSPAVEIFLQKSDIKPYASNCVKMNFIIW